MSNDFSGAIEHHEGSARWHMQHAKSAIEYVDKTLGTDIPDTAMITSAITSLSKALEAASAAKALREESK